MFSDIPELVVLHTEQKKFNVDSVLLTQCSPSWTPETDMVFHCVKSMFLYFLPLGFMLIAYCQIARVLWDEKYFPEEGEAGFAALFFCHRFYRNFKHFNMHKHNQSYIFL